jgi:hypothetical protein
MRSKQRSQKRNTGQGIKLASAAISLALILMVGLYAAGSAWPKAPDLPPGQAPLHIDSVQADGTDEQIGLTITGAQTGCAEQQWAKSEEDNKIAVIVYARQDDPQCGGAKQPFYMIFSLGGYPPGTYLVKVNNYPPVDVQVTR